LDQSGSTNNATRTGALGAAPTFVTSAINGHDAVNFAASGNGSTIQTLVAPFASAVTQPFTVFVVGQIVGNNGATSGDYFFDGAGGTNRVAIALDSSHKLSYYAGGVDFVNSSTLGFGSYHIYEVVFNGSSSTLYQDGTSQVTGSAGSGGIGTNGLLLGARFSGTFGLNGNIADMQIYSGTVSDAQRNAIGAGLESTYGISGTYSVPEPGTAFMLLTGLAAFMGWQFRRANPLRQPEQA
jgi:hypothetical protein